MNKAKFAAVSMGVLASCLFGGYAVVDAATVTLDESAAGTPDHPQPISATYKAYQAAAESPVETVTNHVSADKQKKNNNIIIGKTVRIDNTSYEENLEIPEAPEETPVSAPEEENNQTSEEILTAPETAPVVEEQVQDDVQETTEAPEVPETPQQSTAVTARVFVKSIVSTKTVPETTVPAVQETQETTEPKTTEPETEPVIEFPTSSETEQTETTTEETAAPETTTEETTETQPTEPEKSETTTAPKRVTVKVTTPARAAATTQETTTTSTSTSTTTTTTTTTTTSETTTTETTTTEPIITTVETTTTIPEPEVVDASDFTLDELLVEEYVETPEEYLPENVAPDAAEENYDDYNDYEVIDDYDDYEVVEDAQAEPSYSISDRDYVLLCNCVAHEAGSDVISIENKAKVVEVIMNRVASSSFPNTIYGVITQKSQFTGSSSYADLTTYSSKVTNNVKAAVDLYFADPSAFSHGYMYFRGDGSQNHFRVS